MAVVSISRIQIRRGRRTELPQLASGEFGWAVDSQEIFIGNGAVSEGAPYVGNTKLLTEHDDLFQLADQYIYKNGSTIQTGSTANSPIERTLQARLDEIVNLSSFGATGDGTDHTEILQRALEQLYLGPSTKGTERSRVKLFVEPGVYLISNTVYIPPQATIIGAGIDKTIFRATGAMDTVFQTVSSLGVPGEPAPDRTLTTSLNQANNITVKDVTIESGAHSSLTVDCCKNSIFENIKFTGPYSFFTPSTEDDIAIKLNSISLAVPSSNNQFKNIKIQNKFYGIKSNDDIFNNSFEDCSFYELEKGVDLGSETILGSPGQQIGPSHTKIKQSRFDQIKLSGFIVTTGENNVSENNRYFSVGNEGGNSGQAHASIIDFAASFNQSIGDWFQRSTDLGINSDYHEVRYYPEVAGNSIVQMPYTNNVVVGNLPTPTKLIGFAADTNKSIIVDYIYKSSQIVATRSGTLHITLDPVNNITQITDDYDWIGTDSNNDDNLNFTVTMNNHDSDLILDTLDLNVLNSTLNDDAIISYRVTTKS